MENVYYEETAWISKLSHVKINVSFTSIFHKLLVPSTELCQGSTFGSFVHCCTLGFLDRAWHTVVNICWISIVLGCASRDFLSRSRTWPSCAKFASKRRLGIIQFSCIVEKSESCYCASGRRLCFLCVHVLRASKCHQTNNSICSTSCTPLVYRLPS